MLRGKRGLRLPAARPARFGRQADYREHHLGPVPPGNSGGPLLDGGSNVIGVVEGKLNAIKIATTLGDVPQNANFAIKASVMTTFLDSNGIITSGENPPPALLPTSPQLLGASQCRWNAAAPPNDAMCVGARTWRSHQPSATAGIETARSIKNGRRPTL